MPTDIIYEPTFTQSNGMYAVGDSVWARYSRYWVWAEILQIRFDKSVNISRYRIRFQDKIEAWTSTVESEADLALLYQS